MAVKKKDKHPGGRPTKFDPSLIPRVKKYMLMGVTMEQLADFLDVHKSQVYRWMKKEPKFRDAVMSGREEADANVANSMYRRAVGMKVKSTKIFYDKDAAAMQRHLACESARQMKAAMLGMELKDVVLTPDEVLQVNNMLTGKAGVVAVDYLEVLPPDVKAGIFWLTNRKSEHWKERQQVEQNITADVQHVIEWVEAPNCEPLKTADELEAEEQALNNTDSDANTEE